MPADPATRVRRTVLTGAPVRAKKAAQAIADHIRGLIGQGELAEGDALPPENVLLAQFQVSKPTLREAFRILETESLLETRQGAGGGVFVTRPNLSVASRHIGLYLQLSDTTIADVFGAVELVEPIAVGLLARSHTARDIDELRTAIGEISALDAKTAPSAEAWSDTSFRFHRMLWEKCGNKTLAVQIGVLRELLRAQWDASIRYALSNATHAQLLRKSCRSYSRAVDLIEAGNVEGAQEHWRRHTRASAKRITEASGRAIVNPIG
jgi:GntR family transcriptional repressor for pyruvate dehydrogenase complex